MVDKRLIADAIRYHISPTIKEATQKYCGSSCQMKYEYKHNLRDTKETTKAAHKAVIKKSQERFKTNPNFYLHTNGYWLIYVPRRKWMKYHRYVWEQANSKIPKNMIIHHKDYNKLNNDLDNLQLMTRRDHNLLHYKDRVQASDGKFIS